MADYHIFRNTLQATFFLYIHTYNYKNGAFKTQITRETSPLNALHRIIISPLLNSAERERFRELRDTLITLQRSNPESLSGVDIMMRTMPFMNVASVFQDDMRSRSQSFSSSSISNNDPSTSPITSASTIGSNDGIAHISGGNVGTPSSGFTDWSATSRALGAGNALTAGTPGSLRFNSQDRFAQSSRRTSNSTEDRP